jgi:hypothetical protein
MAYLTSKNKDKRMKETVVVVGWDSCGKIHVYALAPIVEN